MSAYKDGHAESDDSSEDTESTISAFLQKLTFDDICLLDKNPQLDEDLCTCETCHEKKASASETLEEINMIQSYWLELRQYIRIVYRLSMKGSLKSIDEEYRMYMKDIVTRLCAVCNPHQLYQRLEAQVREFLVEVKVRLLQLMDRLAENSRLPRLFISAMLEWYKKMMIAAAELTPVLHQFEVEHLSKFNLSWKVLNQRLFQTNIYTDIFFQNSVPLFITQLGKSCDSDQNKALVREFLSFDDEITQVEGLWADVAEKMKLYTHNQTLTIAKQSYLKREWSNLKRINKGQGKLCYRKFIEQYLPQEEKTSATMCDNESNGSTPCECNSCVHGCSPASSECKDDDNVLNDDGSSGLHVNGNLNGVDRDNEVDPCGATGGEKQSPMHFTKKSNYEGQDSNHLNSVKAQLFKRKPNKVLQDRSEPLDTNVNNENVKLDPIKNVHHAHKTFKDGSLHCDPSHTHCSKHIDPKRVPSDQLSSHTGHSEDSDLSQTDSRHCDCCYCEVFGHGLPVTAPMSRNYQEMRERLRLLLNRKKSKCKSSSNSVGPTVTPQLTHPKKEVPLATAPATVQKDTRALEDLIEFIEGTEVKCKNEKKAAKKARQKEKKKVLLDRMRIEEEQRLRLLEEIERRQKERDQELLEAAQRLEKKKKLNKNRPPETANKNVRKTINGSNNPGSQMVTIKRIMEPHNSEPTVTITLRGATPKQDRVLYTLLNGQVCKVRPQDMNSAKPLKETAKNNAHVLVPKAPMPVPQVKQNNKPIKEPPKQQSSENSMKMKPMKGLTNPTSIQINNAINSMSKNLTGNFNIDDLKLPPGITITKVDPSDVQIRSAIKDKKGSSAPTAKNNASEVIVVATNKLKNISNADDRGSQTVSSSGKKKKLKKKEKEQQNQVFQSKATSSYPGLDIEPIPPGFDPLKNLASQMSVLTINPYTDKKETVEAKSEAGKKKKKKSKKAQKTNMNNQDDFLDSVFAPKDIDLNDGEIDDAERELEAFKLFCLQSVPPQRKEKVNLNLKDIVLKKKSPITCN